MNRVDSLSAQFCSKNEVIVLGKEEGNTIIGYPHEINDTVRKRLERYFGRDGGVVFRSITGEEFEVLLSRLYGRGNGENINVPVKDNGTEINEGEMAKAPPAVNLLNSILGEGILREASDIHLESTEEGFTVRYRKDGKLYRMMDADRTEGDAVTARIKLLSGLNIMEHRRCQDGRFSHIYGHAEYDMRVSVIPGINGESTVIRILGGNIKAPALEELGFSESQMKKIRKITGEGSGLILVTGPTGSGKTTTLASILSELDSEDRFIITVEDPVEYRMKNILQINVDEDAGRSFAQLLRRVLRHDPDILMAGEIRDEESAVIACRMALSGHLVLASIHTGSCEETPLRLTDMGVPPYIVSAVLRGVISQRLIENESGGRRKLKADIKVFDDKKEVRRLCNLE